MFITNIIDLGLTSEEIVCNIKSKIWKLIVIIIKEVTKLVNFY